MKDERKIEDQYCGFSGKYRYTSESKALRAINRYDEIARAYICPSCSDWHTTKNEGLPNVYDAITPDDIQNRINQLK